MKGRLQEQVFRLCLHFPPQPNLCKGQGLFHKALNLGSVSSEIRLEEYQKESNSAEKPCYYLVLWDEISEQLVEDGVYEFEKGSVINVCIRVTDRVQFREYQTYGKVK